MGGGGGRRKGYVGSCGFPVCPYKWEDRSRSAGASQMSPRWELITAGARVETEIFLAKIPEI